MASLTLLEASKNMAERPRAYAEIYAQSSPILSLLPTINEPTGIHGWNIQGTVVGISASRAEGTDFTAASGSKHPRSALAKIYGGKITVDEITAARSPEAVAFDKRNQIASAARLMTIDFFHGVGGSTLGSTDFKGLDTWLLDPLYTGQKVSAGSSANGDYLTMAKLDAAANKLNRSGIPVVMANGTVCIALQTLLRANNNYQQNVMFDPAKFGVAGVHGVTGLTFNNLPVINLDDGAGGELLSVTETATGTGATATSMYFVDMSMDGVMGFTGPTGFKVGTDITDATNLITSRFTYELGFAPVVPRSFVKLYDVKNSSAIA